MAIKSNQLKKFQVKELKDLMRKYNIAKITGTKPVLLSRIMESTHWNIIRMTEAVPPRKKKVFSARQLAAQDKFKVDRTTKKITTIKICPKGKAVCDCEAEDLIVIDREEQVESINRVNSISLKKKTPVETECIVCFNDMDLLVAQIISQSYKKDRQSEVSGLRYRGDLSTSLVAHYEDDGRIILGIHGADDFALNFLALQRTLMPNITQDILDKVCEKFDSLLNDQRDVIVGGHSIGGHAINTCISRHDYPFKFITYASFTPRRNREWSRNRVRKHLFETDWLANNLIKEDNNCLIYKTLHPNSHGLFNFLNKDKMNKSLVSDNSKKSFIETLTGENKVLRSIIGLFANTSKNKVEDIN